MRLALPGSVLLHAALLGWAVLGLDWTPPDDETGVEATMVSIVTLEDFSSETVSAVESTATETLVSAGAAAVEPVEEIEVAEAAEPQTTPAVETAAAEPVESEALASLPVLSATAVPEAEPVEALRPLVTSPLAETVEATALEVERVAALDPLATASVAPEPLEAMAETPPTPLKRPERFKQQTAEAEPAKVSPKTPPKEKPKPPAKKPVAAGNGGKSDADVAASKATAGGKGQKGAAGNAAVSKYPGLVQRALRRALRSPKGGGNARGEVQVTFVVSASGAASQIAVTRSSGHAVLDKEAIATVRRAAPFPPIPVDAGRTSWTFTMPLAFSR